ncbi:hypothetical protein BFJ67_g16864 [Fusarium oxysporum f. sp. cepae]|nr:hypothetical protein BFJ67_g16864 [Fusarium oxysporum f. sp. cepae]
MKGFPKIGDVPVWTEPPDGYHVNFTNPQKDMALLYASSGVSISCVVSFLLMGMHFYVASFVTKNLSSRHVLTLAGCVLVTASQSIIFFCQMRGVVGVHVWEMPLDHARWESTLLLAANLLAIPATALAKSGLYVFYREFIVPTQSAYFILIPAVLSIVSFVVVWMFQLLASPASRVNGAPKKRGSRAKRTRPPPDWDNSPQRGPPVQLATIDLPMSDTPIINRNKEMRKKGGNSNRRSSLGNRGRRASSLIESGQTAIPHREVDPAEFYKHIEAEGLTEPRRMKQLLTWCGERALVGKPPQGTPNSNAILGARAIQDQLLKDFAARSEFSDWFSREEDGPNVPVVLRPNPRNMELDAKLAQLEINIKRLQDEKKAWQAIRKPPPEQPPLFSEGETGPIVLPDFDMLDPYERKTRGFLADETASFDAIRSQTESKLRTIQSSLEFQVDQLADNVHKLEQRVLVAGKEADKVLSVSALRLRQREEREKASAGTRDMPVIEVLRSLGNILPEGGG